MLEPFSKITSAHLAVTTAANESAELIDEARSVALSLNVHYYSRKDRSIAAVIQDSAAENLLIVRRDLYSILSTSGWEYQFHPNLAVVRATNYARTGSDHYLEAAKFQPGDRVIDCTLGFGSEAILASMIVGVDGQVIGLESVPELAIITRNGMGRRHLLQRSLQAAMRRVIVINRDYRDYLKASMTRSADVVYFDPFFKSTLAKSSLTVGALAAFGSRAPLDVRSVTEARRVACRSVIIKHSKFDPLPREIAGQVNEEVSGRRSPVSFSIIPAFGY